MNESKPHTANILIQIEAFETDTVNLIPGSKLAEFGLSAKQKIKVEGFDQFELLKKLKQKIELLKS